MNTRKPREKRIDAIEIAPRERLGQSPDQEQDR
jgi:hypothetical protein